MLRKLTILLLIFITSICKSQVAYNFESGSLTGWLQVPDAHWAASTTTPISGTYSLKHTFNSSVDATDRISIALPPWNPCGGDVTWQVKVRHGYDPSSTNRWWIYLMADQDANQMIPSGTISGYVIGVNLTGTDDLLKLWRVDNGTAQVVLASTLNWQTQIGKTNAGAIEVTRKANGTFTLKGSTSGSFSSLVDYGSITDVAYTDFSYFGISYGYTSSADLLLWVDDILFIYNSLNKNDITSEVIAPSGQISSGTILSTSNSSSASVDVMKFNISDKATLDNLPTKVKNLVFKRATTSNPANWVNTIGGVRLSDESGEIPILNQTISYDKINLTVDSTSLSIPNGQSKEYTLSLYLKSNNLIDGSTLKFYIDSVKHGFSAGLSGSDFENVFPAKVFSNEFKIDVVANALKIISSPTSVSKSTPFTIAVGGVDNAGNLDQEFSNPITLSQIDGTGILTSSSDLTKSPIAGISTWNDLQYNARGTLHIAANSNGFSQVETPTIQVLNDTTSIVTSTGSQPTGVAISSLKTYPAEAVEVLRFRVQDLGETDGLPTIIRNVKISRVEQTDAASLAKAIGGVLIKVNGNPVANSQPDIKTGYMTFIFSNDGLVVPDGGYIDVSLFVFLNETGLTDNQKLQLKVDAVSHGFTADPTGSDFKKFFPLQVISNIFWIDIVATQLKFSSIPTRVGVLQPFNVTLNAIDLNGNIDKDYSGSVNLSLLTGNGTLVIPSGSSMSMTNGICTYSSLTYNIPEKFSLLAGSSLGNIASSLITCGDLDGGVIPLSSITPITVASTSTSSESAVEVMSLKVFDGGSTDGLPLTPTKISLHLFDPTKAELLNKQIDGFVLKADNSVVEVESYSLNNDVFEIVPKSGSLIIPNGDTVLLSLSIYLKKGIITDNFSFRFYIPATDNGWESLSTGTGFATTFSSSVYGPECSLTVAATGLKYTENPFSTIPNQQFSVKVSSTDIYGSIDFDNSEQLTLSLDYGVGELTCSSTLQNLIGGYAQWGDVQFDKTGTYRLKVNGETLGSAFSDQIYCGTDHECIIQEDFEGNLNSGWVGTNNWMLSTISPINGAKSLQQKPSSNSGVNVLSIPISFPSIGDKLLEWDFTLRNGDWDPSTDNYFYFVLMSDSSDLESGYCVGINPSLGNDNLTLWKNSFGTEKTIITTTFDWNANDEVNIRVGLTPKGEWKLWYQQKNNETFSYGGSNINFSKDTMNWCGLVFGYTSSRSGQLWMDDLSVCATDYPPIIKSAKPVNLNYTKVEFSEKVDLTSASNKSNYSIIDKDGGIVNISSIAKSNDLNNEFILKTDRLPFEMLLLKVNGINDLYGHSIKDSIYFGLGESGAFGRLVINEIMANPEPTVGLPAYEYIELFNPTSDTISLNGWKMHLNSASVSFPDSIILPSEYIVLCSTTAVPALSFYGKAIGVTSFPALLNSGMMLRLFDSSGSLISMVDYSDGWYGDESKVNGGWSLEKIDFQNLMEGKNNWKASVSSNGGTPCAGNSVKTSNPDITSPKLISLEVVNDKSIKLKFSEPMDSLMLTFTENYEIDNGIGHPESITMQGDEYSTVILNLSESIAVGVKYNLCFNQSITDFSGNSIAGDCQPFASPQLPVWNDIVINEVLFNPYAGGVDFVEVYNRSAKTVDLSKMLLANRNSTSNLLDQTYSMSDTSRLLFPEEFAIITTDPALVKKYYRTENDKAFIQNSTIPSYNNDEGYVVILNKDLVVVDELHYFESMQDQLLNDFKGVSLERINPDFASSNKSSWHSAAQTVGYATPTYRNSQWVEANQAENEFTLSPETFSPDGDGRDDYLLITYNLPKDGYVATIRIYNSDGRDIKRLASNMLIGTNGTLTWDGLDSKNQKVPIGIYIVYIEYFNPNGEVKKMKKTCVVAEKM